MRGWHGLDLLVARWVAHSPGLTDKQLGGLKKIALLTNSFSQVPTGRTPHGDVVAQLKPGGEVSISMHCLLDLAQFADAHLECEAASTIRRTHFLIVCLRQFGSIAST